MAETLTPMMQQYQRVKREIPTDALLLFRLGDFYELFFDDAKTASSILNLTLTQRNGIPMCGLPHHASEPYITKLVQQGHKVAICDQLEDAGQSKGIVKRGVTQILSPGTMMVERHLISNLNQFLASIHPTGKQGPYGLAILDITTGEFKMTELPDDRSLLSELRRIHPSEILIPTTQEPLKLLLAEYDGKITPYEDWCFEQESAYFQLKDHFKTQSLDGFGCRDLVSAVCAGGGMFHYLQQQLRRSLDHVHSIHVYRAGDYMTLDLPTQRNLELVETPTQPNRAYTLVGALDRTVTAMGGRLIREWITHPLCSPDSIRYRLQLVSELVDDAPLLSSLQEQLRDIRDLERLIARLGSLGGNARDLIALKESLHRLPGLRELTRKLASPMGKSQHEHLLEFPKVIELISKAIADDPPLALKEGGIIRTGYHEGLDELHQASRSGKEWIAQLQQKEMDQSGIKSLKVRFNSVFGYYIEVTKSNLDQVPAHYIRKQTVANGERFITPELKEMEGKILGAEERSTKLEYELFQEIRQQVSTFTAGIQETARAIAVLDVIGSFAETARIHRYCCPQVDDSDVLYIQEGRHPVLEQIMQINPDHMGQGGFVPNDTKLDGQDNQIILITGPNMAGKSTYIRQVALITLLSQIGSFVPARSVHLGIVDRIFTRVGASDDLSRGQSTFMVEMNETANILNNGTSRSLVILDEIGRGTSTYDGISIAWSIAEYLHEQLRARTLFATHYHELTALSQRFPRVKNYNVAVKEWKDQILFLRKIQEGAADKSYGIQVARLAGLPATVINRAREILTQLEASDQLESQNQPPESLREAPSGSPKKQASKRPIRPDMQLSLFGSTPTSPDL